MAAIKIARLLPFLALVVFAVRTVYSWYNHETILQSYHYWAAGLLIANAILYFIKFCYGSIMTAIILLLATFGLIVFNPAKIMTGYSVDANNSPILKTPMFVPVMVLLLILHIIVNWQALKHAYTRFKTARSPSK